MFVIHQLPQALFGAISKLDLVNGLKKDWESTRDALPAAKICKEGFPKVFNKETKSHFSNIEDVRSTDQENVCQCVLG